MRHPVEQGFRKQDTFLLGSSSVDLQVYQTLIGLHHGF